MSWPLIRNLPREFHFDFVRLAPFAAVLSALLIVGSGVSFALQGLNMGIDFVGGAQIEVQTKGPPPTAALRDTVSRNGGEDVRASARPTARSCVSASPTTRTSTRAPRPSSRPS